MAPYNDKIALHRQPAPATNLTGSGRVVSSMHTSPSVLRLLILADYPVVRHGLRQIFGGATDIRIVAEARDAADSMKQISACQPDAVLLDFAGKASYDLFCQIQSHHGDLPILIFSTAHDRYAKKAFHRGAMGYVTKDHAPDHLVLAIRGIVAGERYVWPSIVLDWREQLHACVAAFLASTVKVCNPHVWSSSDRSLPHR
jgi:DNA-binding NarL/FixJ family response regulator